VRELSNLVERLSILCADRVIKVADLPARYRPADWVVDPQEAAAIAPEPALEAVRNPVNDDIPLMDQTLTERQAMGLLEFPPGPGIMRGLDVLPEGGIDLRDHLGAIEERLIRQALERAGGTVARAARLLGLRRTTLVEKLRKFAIDARDDARDELQDSATEI
jgi:sigma-54 specific flagellar transcriptional regulator A